MIEDGLVRKFRSLFGYVLFRAETMKNQSGNWKVTTLKLNRCQNIDISLLKMVHPLPILNS